MSIVSFIPTWLIVVLVIVLLVALFIRILNSNDIFVLTVIKEKFFYFFIFIFLAIFVISVINIHRTNDIDLTSFDGVKVAVKLYYNWFASFFSNVFKVTGYAVHQDWISPGNETSGGG